MTRVGTVLALGSVFCIGVALAIGGLNPRSRVDFSWSQVPCYGGLLDRAERSADVVVLGSSRVLMGIDAGVVARDTGMAPARAFNLAHNDRSYIVDRLLLDDVATRRAPRLAIVEAYVPSRDLYQLERAAPSSSRTNRSRTAPQALDRLAIGFGSPRALPITGTRPLDRLHERVAIVARKVEQFTAFVLTGRLFAAHVPAWRRFDGDQMACRPLANRRAGHDVGIRALYLHTYRPADPDRWQSWPRDRPDLFENPQSASDRAGMRAIADLAHDRAIRLKFLYLPSRFIPPPTDAFVAAFERRIGAPLLVPPPALLERLQRDGFTDEAHMNATGRAIVSAWLARQIALDTARGPDRPMQRPALANPSVDGR